MSTAVHQVTNEGHKNKFPVRFEVFGPVFIHKEMFNEVTSRSNLLKLMNKSSSLNKGNRDHVAI